MVKHILILSSWYPTKKNPFNGNFIQRFAQLVSTKFKVTVLYTQSDDSISNLEYVECVYGNLKEIIIYHPKGRNLFSRYRNQIKALKFGLSKITNVDLIHSSVALPRAHQFLYVQKVLQKPLIHTEHSSQLRWEENASLNFIHKKLIKRLFSKVNKLVCVSDILKSDVQRFTKNKIEVIPNAIDYHQFAKNNATKSNKTRFLHLSNLDTAYKNVEGILDAIQQLAASSLDFDLTIVADTDLTWLNSQIKQRKIEDFVNVFEGQDYDHIPNFYANADAFVLNSDYETFSIVLIEAWASGIPVITTEVGIAFQMDEQLGMLVKKNDTNDLVKKMTALILKEKTFDSEYIKNFALQFDNAKILHQYEKLYTTISNG